jgi:hypothetical protein
MSPKWWQTLALYYYRVVDFFENILVNLIDLYAPVVYLYIPDSSIQANEIQKISGAIDSLDDLSR